jgi:voltage-gated potassium channel
MRERVYEIIAVPKKKDTFSIAYDAFMIFVIIVSLIPLCFKEQNEFFIVIDRAAAGIFILDYILRWITADFGNKKLGKKALMTYPITPFAIIDLLSILPSVTVLSSGFRLLKLLRVLKSLRIFKFLRYSKRFFLIIKVLRGQKKTLISVGCFVLGYIVVAGMIIFHAEPDSFNTLLEALYWVTTTITRANYTGLAPVTALGEIVSMFSSVIGLIVIALPTGIITGAYIAEINDTI